MRLTRSKYVRRDTFDESENSDHPFLIVTKDRYEELRARATSTPWSTWKANAIQVCNTYLIRTAGVEPYKTAEDIVAVVNGCSLAYILDPANKSTYISRFRIAMDTWNNLALPYEMNFGTKPCSNGVIMSLVGLDIFYYELDATTRTNYENRLVALLGAVPNVVPFSNSARGVLSLYRKDAGGVNQSIVAHDNHYFGSGGMVSSDGFFNDGPMYGWFGFDLNLGQGFFFDIISFSGYKNYYQKQELREYYDWLFHFGASPPLTHTVFAEARISHWDREIMGRALLLWTSAKWSEEISRHSAWMVNELKGNPKYTLFTYVLMEKALPEPLKPTSKIYYKGGAAFWERNPSQQSLMVAMQSQTRIAQHSRKEPNNLNIMGFGEYLLVNPGYAKWGYPCKDSVNGISWPWDWFRNDRRAENAITIGPNIDLGVTSGNNRDGIITNGIIEGFVSGLFDYASGDSGSAIPEGNHTRNLIMVHPTNNENQGYFVLFDEIHSKIPNQDVYLHLHPNSYGPTTITERQEYQFKIDLITAESQKQEYLSMFYGTTPEEVSFPNGGIAFRQTDDGCYTVKYPRAKYFTDALGDKVVVTVLFPHDPNHSKAKMTRLEGTGFSGTRIDHANSSDFAIESHVAAVVTPSSGVSLQGKASVYRTSSGSNKFYFVRLGRSFRMGAVGFASTAESTIFMRGLDGQIITAGADVTFYGTEIQGIKINGQKATLIGKGPGFVQVRVVAGQHMVQLVTDKTAPQVGPRPPSEVKAVSVVE